MNPAPATEAKTEKSTEPKYAPRTKLAVLYFRESVMFGTELSSAAISKTGGNSVDSILPGRLADDGSLVLGGEGATGFVLRKKRHDLHNNTRSLDQAFVPFSNVKSVGFSE